MAKRFLTPIQLATLDAPPASPSVGQIYYNLNEQTIKAYNGVVWYDVAGPKEILEHTHGIDGIVDEVSYGDYVDEDRVIADSSNVNANFIEDYIDGGSASGN
jgi:hypothetical protein